MSHSIICLITDKLNNCQLPYLEIAVRFTLHKKLNKTQKEGLSNAIVDLDIKLLTSKDSRIQLINDYKSKIKYPWEIDFITVYYSSLLEYRHVHSVYGRWVQTESILEIQNILDIKNIKLKENYKNCIECWLSIYSKHSSSEGFFDPSNETLNFTYNSLFD